MFGRFALEESNPADESEAEYASAYDDDVELPGAFLKDELSKKRNQFEDVYPEVSHVRHGSRESPPGSLARPARNKRDRDEEEEADCANGAHEEYYYEEEAPEASSRGNNKRSSHSAAEYIDGYIGGSIDGEQRMPGRKMDAISAVNRRSLGKSSEANEEEGATPLEANARVHLTSAKNVKASNTLSKISAAKTTSSLVKRKPLQKPRKERNRLKPKPKPKLKAKPRPKKPKPRENPKRFAGAQTAKLNSDCCKEDVERASDPDRRKRDKTLVIKAVPTGKNLNELQVYQKAEHTKKKAVSKVAEKHSSAKDLTALSIGEVKDMLGKLMMKIDNLRDLVSELKNGEIGEIGGEPDIEDLNEKPTRLNSPADNDYGHASCRRRWAPWTRWSACSVTCGRGAQSRSRSCLAGCRHVSLESEERVCSHPECPAATKFLGIF